MDKKLQDLILKNKNIHVIEFPMTSVPFVLKRNDEFFIVVNKGIEPDRLYWIIEHELAHIMTDTFYLIDSSNQYKINMVERKADKYLIEKNGLKTKIKKALQEGLNKEEICESMQLPTQIYDAAMNEINIERIKYMTNCVNLLCMRDDISADELALLLGISKYQVLAILEEKAIIDYLTLEKLSRIFDVDPSYILCV